MESIHQNFLVEALRTPISNQKLYDFIGLKIKTRFSVDQELAHRNGRGGMELKAISRKFTLIRGVNFKISLGTYNRIQL